MIDAVEAKHKSKKPKDKAVSKKDKAKNKEKPKAKSSKSKNKPKSKNNNIPTAQVVANPSSSSNTKVRVVAHTQEEISNALAKGCSIVRDARTIKALSCSKETADTLGLQEDRKLKILDTSANAQIGADIVQASGNTGAGRKIVVLDSGYNYNAPELSSSYLGGYDFVNDDNDPMDDLGHGTAVSTVATGDGVTDPTWKGVAPDVGVIAGKVCGSEGDCYDTDIIAAIYWAVDGPDGIYGTDDDFNVDAISISIGGAGYDGYCDFKEKDFSLAINYAKSKGVLTVAGAGNGNTDGTTDGVKAPACVSSAIAVGAVNASDVIAYFSSTGKAVDIVAPGVGINGGATGTSYSTPMVSGTIALIKSAHPEYTAEQVQEALFQTAKDLGEEGKDTVYGWGRVNASAAVVYPATSERGK